MSDKTVEKILPNKSGIWGKVAFTLSLVTAAVLLANYVRSMKTHKEEKELLMLNLQKARMDLGLNPATGRPV